MNVENGLGFNHIATSTNTLSLRYHPELWILNCNTYMEISNRRFTVLCVLISIYLFIRSVFPSLSLSRTCTQIRLDSASILMPNLKIVPSSVSGSSSSQPLSSLHDHHHQPAQHHHKIYQLCACSNGKLFLAMSHSICAGDESTVCRWFNVIYRRTDEEKKTR